MSYLCRSLPQALLDDFDYSDDEEESLEKKMASQPNQQQDGNPQDTGYVPFSACRIYSRKVWRALNLAT